MIRISGKKDGDGIAESHVYHPESAALEARIVELIHQELHKFGLDVQDAHQIHNDLLSVREQRENKKKMAAIVIKTVIAGMFAFLGALILSGLNSMYGRN